MIFLKLGACARKPSPKHAALWCSRGKLGERGTPPLLKENHILLVHVAPNNGAFLVIS